MFKCVYQAYIFSLRKKAFVARALAGTNYEFRKIVLDNGLVECEKTGKRSTRMRVTEKGRMFLTHYRVCNELLPS